MYKVEAVVCNTGFMPKYATNAFNTLNLAKDIEVTLSGAEAADGNPTKKAVWYVRGEQGTEITISVCSQKAGKASDTIKLA